MTKKIKINTKNYDPRNKKNGLQNLYSIINNNCVQCLVFVGDSDPFLPQHDRASLDGQHTGQELNYLCSYFPFQIMHSCVRSVWRPIRIRVFFFFFSFSIGWTFLFIYIFKKQQLTQLMVVNQPNLPLIAWLVYIELPAEQVL